MQYLCLVIAIAAEVVATATLRSSAGFTRMVPSLVVLGGYVTAFIFLSVTLKLVTTPIAVIYAIWSGAGITALTAISYFYYGDRVDTAALIGMTLIVTGIAVIRLFSNHGLG